MSILVISIMSRTFLQFIFALFFILSTKVPEVFLTVDKKGVPREKSKKWKKVIRANINYSV